MRRTLAVIAALVAVILLVVTLTAPMIAAAGPAILTVAFAVLAWLLWPKNRVRREV